jgi:hypothetical protein
MNPLMVDVFWLALLAFAVLVLLPFLAYVSFRNIRYGTSVSRLHLVMGYVYYVVLVIVAIANLRS